MIRDIQAGDYVHLVYPPLDQTGAFELYLEHVRAASPIRIFYDGKRDGWAIQRSVWVPPERRCADGFIIEAWNEVAFVPGELPEDE